MPRRKPIGRLLCLLLVGLVGLPFWFTYRQLQRERATYALLEAIKQNDTAAAISSLDAGANPKARDLHTEPYSIWFFLLATLRGRPPQPLTAGPMALLLLQDPGGNSILDLAHDHSEIAHLLKQAGAKP